MSILRNPHRERYTVVTADALEDERLSWEARGVLVYLLGRPDGWQIRPTHLQRIGGCGKDKMSRILRELRETGYLEKRHPRGQGGKVQGTELVLHECPAETRADGNREPENPDLGEAESRENRDPEKPSLGKPGPLVNKDLLAKTENPANTDSQAHAKQPTSKKSLDTSVLPNDLSQQVLDDWLSHRKNIKAPATKTVIDRVAKELEIARRSGWTPDNALGEALEAGWRGFKAQWLVNRQNKTPAAGGNHVHANSSRPLSARDRVKQRNIERERERQRQDHKLVGGDW